MPLFLQLFNKLQFLFRKKLGLEIIDPDFFRYSFGYLVIVSGEHRDLFNTHSFQRCNGVGGLRANLVGNSNQADRFVIISYKNGCSALFGLL